MAESDRQVCGIDGSYFRPMGDMSQVSPQEPCLHDCFEEPDPPETPPLSPNTAIKQKDKSEQEHETNNPCPSKHIAIRDEDCDLRHFIHNKGKMAENSKSPNSKSWRHKSHSRTSSLFSLRSHKSSSPPTPTKAPIPQDSNSSPDTTNFDAVSRALEQFKLDVETEQGRRYADDLRERMNHTRQTEHAVTHNDARSLLKEAMYDRDHKQPEACRALCLRILAEPTTAADVRTQICACNMLSSQASGEANADEYLDTATKLVKTWIEDKAERKELLRVNAMLREGAHARGGAPSKQ